MGDVVLSKKLAQYHEKGMAALEKNNFDYAVELLLQVVQEEPLHAAARKALRLAERSRFEESPPSPLSQFLLKLSSLLPLIMALVYESMKQNAKAVAFYEEVLKYFPNDLSVLRKIAVIADKQNWLEVAAVAHEDLLEVRPEESASLRRLGYLYRELNDVEKAKKYLKKLLEQDPLDQEVKKDLKDLEALSTIQAGNWEDSQSYRSKLKSPASATQDASLEAGGVSIAALEQRVDQDPTNENHLYNLALAYKKNEQFDEAKRALARLKELNSGSSAYRDLNHEVMELYYLKTVNTLNKKLGFDPSNESLRQEVRAVQQEKMAYDIAQVQAQVALYPNDLGLRFQLGSLQIDQGNYDEAISQFQLSVKDPARQLPSLMKLGLCFKAKGMFDLAVVQFQKVLELSPVVKETTKETIYQLGETLQAMGKPEEAYAQFKKIYEVDIGYRDVAGKVDAYYKQKGTS